MPWIKNYWLFDLASLSPAETALTKIAGFEVIAQGQQEYIEVYFSKNLGKYYAMVNLDTVTFLDPASLYNKLELDVDDQKIAHSERKIIAAASSPR